MDEATLVTKVLTSFHIPLEWGERQWETALDHLLLDWQLRADRITAVIFGTTRVELLTALTNRGFAWVPCLLHSLQIGAKSCFDGAGVATLLEKCRNIIVAMSAAFIMREQKLKVEENAMVLDYPRVWTSTYHMLEQMALRRNRVASLLEGMEENDQEIVSLSNEQWRIVEDLVKFLKPLKAAVITLSEEKMPLVSLLKPFLWKLLSSDLKVQDSDSKMARSSKESLFDVLCDRYFEPSVRILL